VEQGWHDARRRQHRAVLDSSHPSREPGHAKSEDQEKVAQPAALKLATTAHAH
jgi:hypothetical protein